MSNILTDNLQRSAGMFGALGNPNRLRIFLRLMSCCGPEAPGLSEEQATAFVGELGKDLGIAASTVSHHIKELHRSGLIQMERRGQRVACWVDRATLRELSEFFSHQLDRQPSCSCRPTSGAAESS
jgi:ArsR family transcriptional regulator